jgi:hypothetical protein
MSEINLSISPKAKMTYAEYQLTKDLKEIGRYKDDKIADEAKKFWKFIFCERVGEKRVVVRGGMREMVIRACIYISLEIHQIPFSSAIFRIEHDAVMRGAHKLGELLEQRKDDIEYQKYAEALDRFLTKTSPIYIKTRMSEQ